MKNVSFKVQDGEFVFIIGLSGSGKSTLVKLLTCEENPSNGKVFIDGYEISFLRRSLIPYLRRNIGMVFQDFRLIYSKTVYENVAFAMEIIGASSSLIKRRVPIVLSIVGLRDKAATKANHLSGGEQQRVVIARAMVNNPMLILADEPTGNLDPVNSESIMALLEEINLSGTTVIVCTHESNIVNKMHRRVIEISDGCLVRDEMLGAYNLENSNENQQRKNKKIKARPHHPTAEAIHQDPLRPLPFVRNINIKFGEDADPVRDMTSSENENTEEDAVVLQKTEEIRRTITTIQFPYEPAAVPAPVSVSAKTTETQETIEPDDAMATEEQASPDQEPKAGQSSAMSDEEILLTVSNYYQKKVLDYQHPDLRKQAPEYKVAAKQKLEVPAETGPVDFQHLIKPKRVEQPASTEDLR